MRPSVKVVYGAFRTRLSGSWFLNVLEALLEATAEALLEATVEVTLNPYELQLPQRWAYYSSYVSNHQVRQMMEAKSKNQTRRLCVHCPGVEAGFPLLQGESNSLKVAAMLQKYQSSRVSSRSSVHGSIPAPNDSSSR